MKTTIENIENGLGDRYKRNPFTVPEGYFEGFEARLTQRIEQQAIKASNPFMAYLKPIVAIAAVLVLALVLTTIQFPKLFNSSDSTVLADNEELNNSIGQAFISTPSEAQILAAFSESEQLDTKKISPENITNYIADNYSEYEIILNN